MAVDKYNLQYSILTIIQKSSQYLLAMMKYHAQKARQEEELAFYERIYGKAMSSPDAVRMAYTEDDLTPEAMKQLAAENGIHVEVDPGGRNYFIYDVKDEEALYRIVEEAGRKERAFFESNHFHETQYGYSCYKTGEFIPYVDETGSFIDSEGKFHRGLFAGNLQDDEIREALESRSYNDNAVWDRDQHGNLKNEFGSTICPVDIHGRFYNEETGKIEFTAVANEWYQSNVWEASENTPVFTMTSHGNMVDQDENVYELPNEYGDILHEDGSVSVNKKYSENYDERVISLRQRNQEAEAGRNYVFDQDHNFVASDGDKILFRTDNGSYQEKGVVKLSQPAAGFEMHSEKDKSYTLPVTGEEETVYTRCPGGYDPAAIRNYNEYGDYYAAEDGEVILNSNIKGNEEFRIQRILAAEQNPINNNHEFIKNLNGNLVNLDTGAVVTLRHEDGSRCMELDGHTAQGMLQAPEIAEEEIGEERDRDAEDNEVDYLNDQEEDVEKQGPEDEEPEDSHDVPDEESETEEDEGKRQRRKGISPSGSDEQDTYKENENQADVVTIPASGEPNTYDEPVSANENPDAAMLSDTYPSSEISSTDTFHESYQEVPVSDYNEGVSAEKADQVDSAEKKHDLELSETAEHNEQAKQQAYFNDMGTGSTTASPVTRTDPIIGNKTGADSNIPVSQWNLTNNHETASVLSGVSHPQEGHPVVNGVDGYKTPTSRKAETDGIPRYSFTGSSGNRTENNIYSGREGSDTHSKNGEGNQTDRNTVRNNFIRPETNANYNRKEASGSVEGNTVTLNKDALNRKKESERDDKAAKYGFENMTAVKKYGFHSMAPISQLSRPSSEGLIGSFAGGFKQLAYGSSKDSHTNIVRYGRTIGAAFSAVGGRTVYRNAIRSSSEYFMKLQQSGGISSVNSVLAMHGYRSVDLSSATGIKIANESLMQLAGKQGMVVLKGKQFIGRDLSDAAFIRLGARSAEDIARLRNVLKTAISQRNGMSMMKSGGHVLYYSVRMSLMNTENGSLGYVGQGMDTVRVAAQTYKAVQNVRRTSIINKHLKYKKNTELLKKPAPGISASQYKAKFVKSPLRRNALNKEERLMNAKAVKQYKELRMRENASRWNKSHRGIEKKYEKLQRVENARIKKLEARKQLGNAIKKNVEKPFRYAYKKFSVTGVGRRVDSVGKKIGAAKKWVKNTKPYRLVSSTKNAVSKAVAGSIEKISKVINFVARKLMLFVGIYLIVCLVIAFIASLTLIPLMGIMSAETNDEELNGGVAMEDVYDKSNTMTGIIYNELRYMEVQWASETRTYGTSVKPLSLNELNFTEYNVSARQYALSQTGADDLIGIWAYDSTKETDGKKYEGVLGPEPFEGAALEDYKLLRDIDGGNTLELRGKPQEGYTSNAKQITSMASVFFGQELDTLREESNVSKGVAGFIANAKRLWKAAWTFFEKNDVPVLGWIAKHTGWSWTSVYRNYAYPLMQASHQENFFLSSYIYPTKYTQDTGDARWDGVKGGNPDETGDQTVKVDQMTGLKAKNGRIGVDTEGGSGKVTSDFLVSDDIYQGYGDDGWESIEICPEDQYGGYGCQKRLSFSYKYSGHFATDQDLNVTHEDELRTLYYGGNPDIQGEYDNTSDVSADVSPWDNDSDMTRGYNRDSCIINILQLTDDASKCWELDSTSDLTDYDFEENTPLLDKTFHSSDMNSEYLNRSFSDFNAENNLTIQKVEETENGCDVYVSYPFQEENVYDDYGNALLDENDEPIKQTIYTNDGLILHFKHNCQADHMGVYCGGHLQLKTRGVVYGFSEKQCEEGTLSEDGAISAYAPKFLDPINYKDGDGSLPDDSDVEEIEKNAYPDLHVWNVNEHSLPDGEDTPYINEDDLKKMYLAEDIFDIDSMILRKRDSYPGYSTSDESKISESLNSALGKWSGWTLPNMGHAVSLAASDWFENYALADTQTAVGGIYNSADQQYLNALSNELINRILAELDTGLNMNADILDPEAKNIDGDILTDDERTQIDGIRHVMYALNSVGKTGYSQAAHANMYGNVAGHDTDCSGFVSNIWRDRIDAPLTVSGLYSSGEVAPREYHGIGTQGIEPGDIILVSPDSSEREAHALIYIGTFNTADLYGGDSGEERVFTVDCSSMVFTTDDLASQEDTPVKSWFVGDDGEKLSLKDGYRNYERNGKSAMVRSGNVRFCDREYVNEDTPDMYYLDMSEWPRIGQRQLGTDFSELGDSTGNYWDNSSIITDLTQIREEKDIEFPISIDVSREPVEDVDIPEDDRKEPSDGPDGPVRDGKSVILPMNQYINQGSGSWSQVKRGGIGSNDTVKQSGCIDCSYLMVASYYNNTTYNVGSILSKSKYYSGNQFLSGPFLGDYGLSQSVHSGYSQQGIRDAIDMGHPVILHIRGTFSFHPRNSGHFLVIMGYNDDGFMFYDPGSNANSYCITGNVIPYNAFTNGPGTIPEYRVITQN